jgi:hypothetical protein
MFDRPRAAAARVPLVAGSRSRRSPAPEICDVALPMGAVASAAACMTRVRRGGYIVQVGLGTSRAEVAARSSVCERRCALPAA